MLSIILQAILFVCLSGSYGFGTIFIHIPLYRTTSIALFCQMYETRLELGESDQVGTNTETSARAGRGTDTGGVHVENREGCERSQGNHSNLGQLQDLAGEHIGRNGNGQTLQGILHEASHNIAQINRRLSSLLFGHFIVLFREIIRLIWIFIYCAHYKQMPRETLPTREDDGTTIDYLEEDPEVPTQRYCIISFISPEKVLEQKAEFYNSKFVEWLEYDWKIKGMEKYNAFLAQKYSLKVEDLFADLAEFTKVHNTDIAKTDIHEQHAVFLLKKEKEIESLFTEKVQFQTNVRGVKVRRIFADLQEAQMYAKVLQRRYPRDNLYVGKVGAWLPWDPSEHMMPEVEYAEKELNELMRKYKENETNREIFFEEEKTMKMEKQKKENAERTRKTIEELAAETNASASEAQQIQDSIERPVHPTEGGVRDL